MTSHPIVQKFLDGQLPEALAGPLVAGSLPVPPADLIHALAFAVFRETPLAAKALETFQSMPEGLLSGALAGPVSPPDPLGLILQHRKEQPLLEAALLHPDLTAEWMERSIPFLPGALLEIPLNNQVLWLERPAILDLLETHPEAEYQIKRRVNEFRRDVLRQVSGEVAQERMEIIDEVEAGRLDRSWSDLPLPQEDASEDEPQESPETRTRAVAQETGEEVNLSLTQRVMRLRTNQKIMLAVKGGKEERTLLIREANRLIQVNVIRNPRITEGEIAFVAQMRTVNEEVLRIIASNRDWMKKYTVVKNLVLNPKTPLPIAMNHLKRLMDMDMRLLVKDRNVAELLRREAKRHLASKQT
jgi:hypothetical protein